MTAIKYIGPIALIITFIGYKVNAKLYEQGIIGLSLLIIILDTLFEKYQSRKYKKESRETKKRYL